MLLNTTMKILAIDQSYTSSGIVIIENDTMTYAERYVTSKELSMFERAGKIADHINMLAELHNPDIIAIEGLAFGMRGNATRDLAGLQFVIAVAVSYNNNYTLDIIAPLTVKKFATGNGRAKKEELLESTPAEAVRIFKDDLKVKKTTGLLDMVDAYWIGKTSYNNNNMEN